MTKLSQGWQYSTLEEVGSPKISNIDPSQYPNETFELYSVPSYSAGSPEIVKGSVIGSTKQAVEPGDVLLCKIVPHLVRVWVVPDQGQFRQIASGEWIVVRAALCDPHYLRRLLMAREFREKFMGAVSGVGGSLMRARPKAVSVIRIPIAPRNEQQRIVAKLESLFERTSRAREELSHIPHLIELYKKAILEAAFRGDLTADWRSVKRCKMTDSERVAFEAWSQIGRSRLRGSRLASLNVRNEDVAADIPDGWSWGRLIDVIHLKAGFAFKSSSFCDSGIPLVRGVNVSPGRLDWGDVVYLSNDDAPGYSDYLIEEGDILLAMDRPLISSGLKVAIAAGLDTPSLLVQRVARIRPNDWAFRRYLWWFFNSQRFLDFAVARSTGSDLPHISGNDISLAPVPIPPLAEQKEIARRLDEKLAIIFEIQAQAKNAVDRLGHLDRVHLAKAFRGELVPQDPNDEPASVLLERIRAGRAAQPAMRKRRRPS